MIYDFSSRGQLLIAINFLLLPVIIGPWFANFFRDPKWVLLYFSTLLLIPFIKSIPKINVPKIFIPLFVVVMVFHYNAPLSPFLIDIVCFIILTLATFDIAKKSPDSLLDKIVKFNIIATVLVLAISYLLLKLLN